MGIATAFSLQCMEASNLLHPRFRTITTYLRQRIERIPEAARCCGYATTHYTHYTMRGLQVGQP